MEGQETIHSGSLSWFFLIIVVGPIAHSISDIRFFINTILQVEPWFKDPKVIEMPWRTEQVDKVKGRPITVGIIKWDSLVMPHPPVQRGLRMVVEALKSQGHDVIDFDVPDPVWVNSLTVNPCHLD
jgi:amidase